MDGSRQIPDGATHQGSPVLLWVDWIPISEANRHDHWTARRKRNLKADQALQEAVLKTPRPDWLVRVVEESRGQAGLGSM